MSYGAVARLRRGINARAPALLAVSRRSCPEHDLPEANAPESKYGSQLRHKRVSLRVIIA
jgi:hypothetical protein